MEPRLTQTVHERQRIGAHMAEILPFPLARRRSFVAKTAAHMAAASTSAAESHLARQVQVQVETMQRRGIAPDHIAREARSLECAVRAALWRLLLSPGGTA